MSNAMSRLPSPIPSLPPPSNSSSAPSSVYGDSGSSRTNNNLAEMSRLVEKVTALKAQLQKKALDTERLRKELELSNWQLNLKNKEDEENHERIKHFYERAQKAEARIKEMESNRNIVWEMKAGSNSGRRSSGGSSTTGAVTEEEVKDDHSNVSFEDSV
jgi:hypothetical protein